GERVEKPGGGGRKKNLRRGALGEREIFRYAVENRVVGGDRLDIIVVEIEIIGGRIAGRQVHISAAPFNGDVAAAQPKIGGVEVNIVGDVGAGILYENRPDDVEVCPHRGEIKIGGGIQRQVGETKTIGRRRQGAHGQRRVRRRRSQINGCIPITVRVGPGQPVKPDGLGKSLAAR